MRRDWSATSAKRQAAKFCRACGQAGALEAAHLVDRGRDRRVGGVAHVEEDSVVFLCGPFPEGCHGAYDRKVLDLYPVLTVEELGAAVKLAGGPGMALRRLSGPLWRAEADGDLNAGRLLDERVAYLESL